MNDDLYREICRCPEDDTLRLAYADWLDENGDPDRAEFVRCQMDWGRGRNEDRAYALLVVHTEWPRLPCPTCLGTGAVQIWIADAQCGTCHGMGDLFRHRVFDPGLGPNAVRETARTVTFARGFPDAVSCTLAEAFDSDGTPTAWACEVVRRTPVTRFVLTDKTPFSFADELPPCRWLRCDGTASPTMLPDYLFDEIPGNGPTAEYDHWGRFYALESAAVDALAVASGRLVRRHVYGEVPA